MVIGIGTDLIEIGRVEASIERFGERFLERIFTPGEIAYCMQKKASAESFAARFGAKGAGAKALGGGGGRGAERAEAMGVVRTELSLTHSRAMAMALVVVEGLQKQ